MGLKPYLILLLALLGAVCIAFMNMGNILHAGDMAVKPDEPGASEKQEILVRFKSHITVQEAEKMACNLGLEVIKAYPPMTVTQGRVLLLVKSRDLTGEEVIDLLRDQSEVDHAEIEVIRSIETE